MKAKAPQAAGDGALQGQLDPGASTCRSGPSERIVDLMLNDLRARLSERRMTLEISDKARRFIAQQGFDPIYGARPLRRFISREVETRIGRALLAGDVLDGAVIRIGYADGELTVSYETRTDP